VPIAQVPASLIEVLEFSKAEITRHNERRWFEWARSHCGPLPLPRLRPLQAETRQLLEAIVLVRQQARSAMLPAMELEQPLEVWVQYDDAGQGRVRLLSKRVHRSSVAPDQFRLFVARTIEGFEDRLAACTDPTCAALFIATRKVDWSYCSNRCYRRDWMRAKRQADSSNTGPARPCTRLARMRPAAHVAVALSRRSPLATGLPRRSKQAGPRRHKSGTDQRKRPANPEEGSAGYNY
jgi:hypothetical protein